MLSKEKDTAIIRRVLLEEVRHLIVDLKGSDCKAGVHRAHKRCKRIRAIIRLVRPVAEAFYQEGNNKFRDLARSLSDLRDSDVIPETFVRVEKGEKTTSHLFASLLDGLVMNEEQTPALVKAKVASCLRKVDRVKVRVDNFIFPEDTPTGLIRVGIVKSYKRGRKAMVHAYHGNKESAFHKWRKRVKELDYQMQLLPRSNEMISQDWQKKLDELGNVLGQKHDLLILCKTLCSNSRKGISNGHLARYLELLDANNCRLTAKAKKLGHHLYSLKLGSFARRLALTPIWRVTVPDLC
jgi:CHAD domain-containing protein